MKNINTYLLKLINEDSISLVTCWLITRADGIVLGFTNHCESIFYQGVEYRPECGDGITENYANLDPSDCVIAGFIDQEAFTLDDLRAERYINAQVKVSMLSYENPELGDIIIKHGFVSSYSIYDKIFVLHVSCMAEPMNKPISTFFSYRCRAKLGDSKCQVRNYIFPGAVTATYTKSHFTDSSLMQAGGYFDYGEVVFISGSNTGICRAIAAHTSNGIITTSLPFPFNINIGDSFQISAGCSKLFTDCINKFNNAANFRGEPYLKIGTKDQ